MKTVVIHAAKDLRVEPRDAGALTENGVRVRIEYGGICGSDLHYYNHGGFGAVRLREPMILGHEVSGTITESADASGRIRPGDRVAISPSRPCGACRYCQAGHFNHCLNMRFYGSAMPMPHIQGAFREELVAEAGQCFKIDPSVPRQLAAFAEPLAVVLHAFNRAGPIAGKTVLVTGCGPIGALCILVARAKEAGEVVVTDILDPVLDIARRIGADRAINVAKNPGWTAEFAADKGGIDVMIEASGTEAALAAGLEVLRPRSVLVQLGLGGDISLSQNTIVAKEIEIRGAFRFHEEFGTAVEMINAGTLDLAALLSATFPLDEAQAAFELAGDRSKAMKVQLDFSA